MGQKTTGLPHYKRDVWQPGKALHSLLLHGRGRRTGNSVVLFFKLLLSKAFTGQFDASSTSSFPAPEVVPAVWLCPALCLPAGPAPLAETQTQVTPKPIGFPSGLSTTPHPHPPPVPSLDSMAFSPFSLYVMEVLSK